VSGLRWRLLRDDPAPGPVNMARDHALARCLGAGEGVLRLYGWSEATVSLGRNEPALERYARVESGPPFVRRPTGGRAVLHASEVTYAVALPERAWGGPRASYRRIHQALVQGLLRLNVAAEVATAGAALPPDAGPCFRRPAAGEVVLGGRKLVGSAQARMEGVILQHGSVLLSGDQDLLARLRGEEPSQEDRPATLAQDTGSAFTADVVMDALAEGARLAWPGAWRKAPYSDREQEEVDLLRRERYGDEAWTWRR